MARVCLDAGMLLRRKYNRSRIFEEEEVAFCRARTRLGGRFGLSWHIVSAAEGGHRAGS